MCRRYCAIEAKKEQGICMAALTYRTFLQVKLYVDLTNIQLIT